MGKIKAAKAVAKGAKAAAKAGAEKQKRLGVRGYRVKKVEGAKPLARKKVTKLNRTGNKKTTTYTGIGGSGVVSGTRKIKNKKYVAKSAKTSLGPYKGPMSKTTVTSRSLRPAILGRETSRTGSVAASTKHVQKNPVSLENAAYAAAALTPAETAEARKIKKKRSGTTTYKRRLASGKTITVTRKR